MAKRKERRGGRRGGKQGRKEEGERGEEKAKEEEEEKKGKGTHPLHPFYTASHLVRGVPGPRKKRCRPSRGHPRHHWHCLGDLTPVLASYSDITGLFCSSRLRRTFLAPRLGLQSGTTSCRRARQRTQMNTAALTPPFRRFKKGERVRQMGTGRHQRRRWNFFGRILATGIEPAGYFSAARGKSFPPDFFRCATQISAAQAESHGAYTVRQKRVVVLRL